MRQDEPDNVEDTQLLEDNYAIFRDCVSDIVIQRLSPQVETKQKRIKARKNQIKPVEQTAEDVSNARVNDAEELGEFIEVYTFRESARLSLIDLYAVHRLRALPIPPTRATLPQLRSHEER
jgi:hypothetical protein